MNLLAFNGSPRRIGNTSLLLAELLHGAREVDAHTDEIIAKELDLKYCAGCLKCNVLQRCVVRDDAWRELSQKILDADVLVFASPIYFHHLTASLKKVLDRFRSFIHVQITEHGLKHTPWHKWSKQFVLLLCLGSSVANDTVPVINLFRFIVAELGSDNKLYTIIGNRLAVVNQIKMTRQELSLLYQKLNLPSHLVKPDYERNQSLLKRCYEFGKELGTFGIIKSSV